jgi:hypothetical protein
MTSTVGPRLLDGAALLSSIADELVVRTVRDTHAAWADRTYGALRGPTIGLSRVPEVLHRSIAAGVYAGLGASLRGLSTGLSALGARGIGPGLEDTSHGRFAAAAANGLIGDRLADERPRLAVRLAVRRDGRDVGLDAAELRSAFPDATPRVAVLLHGWCESETAFDHHRDRVGATYPDTLTELGWTPVLLRANTGAALRENGVALASLLQELVDGWPVPVERLALVGHSMGGLAIRTACVVATERDDPWTDLVTDVVTLGTPHLGAPLAGGAGAGARALAVLPETAAFGRILDQRSAGVRDLVSGFAEEVPPLPHARYHLVSATLSRSPRHPVGRVLGDLLVSPSSAYGRPRRGAALFPGADELHLPRSGHFDLLNHPDVHRALRDWLGGSRAPRTLGPAEA